MTKTWMTILAGGAVSLLLVGGLRAAQSAAAGPPSHAAVVASGVLNGRPWRVAVRSQGLHRKGVCLQTLTKTGETLACSAPVRRRGIVTVQSDGRAPHGRARITVIAAALNQTVGTLRLVLRDGSAMNLHARRIRAKSADAHIKSFRYLARAVRGSLCAERVETIGLGGDVLWQVPEGELARMGLVCKPGG